MGVAVREEEEGEEEVKSTDSSVSAGEAERLEKAAVVVNEAHSTRVGRRLEPWRHRGNQQLLHLVQSDSVTV